MRERKYIKFRVDMHEDTKFKIIDRKPERDVIHYIWTRIVMLAGKVNLQDNDPINLETQKSKKSNKKKKREKAPDMNIIDGEFEDNSICYLTDGVKPLGEGESTILEWSFG